MHFLRSRRGVLGLASAVVLVIAFVLVQRALTFGSPTSEPISTASAANSTPSVDVSSAEQSASPVPTDESTTTATPSPEEGGNPVASPANGGSTIYLPVVVGPPGDTATPTPTSTPTPVSVAAPASTPIPTPTRKPIRITKLGLGVYDSGGGMLPALDQSRPSVILLMDPSIDFAQSVRKKFPQAFIVGRIFAPSQPLDNPAARGTAFADQVAASAVPLKGVVNAWMSYNEVSGASDPQSLMNYNTFQVAFAHQLQDHYGIPAVCNNDGPRSIPAAFYPRYFGAAISTCKYFGFHIYPDKKFTSLRDPAAADQVFYYRQIYQALVGAGIQPGPFIATEVGLWDGWQGVTTDASMGQDFTWLADQMNQDSYVLGMTVYGLFAPGRSEWDRFDVDHSAILNIMGDYNTQP